MKMRIEMLPKFDGIPQEKKEKAVEAFVKHLEEAKWFVGQREAEIEVFLMGPAGNRTLELSLDVNDAELTLV